MGLKLNHLQFGDAGPPIVVVHGLFGSARNWAGIAKRLAETHRVFALDLRNHGESPWADDMSFAAMAGDIGQFIEDHELDRPAVIGHSLGGKAVMALALSHPESIRGLVAVDIAPAAYRRSFRLYVETMMGMDMSVITRRADADALLSDVVPEPGVRQFLLQNLVLGEGEPRWRLNLAVLGSEMDIMGGAVTLDGGAPYAGPALFLAGGDSYYLRPEHEPAIRQLFPNAKIDAIDGAGHWVHAEKPEEFLERARRFLDGLAV